MKIITTVLLATVFTTSVFAQDKKAKTGYASIGGATLIGGDFSNKANINAGIGLFIGKYLSAGPAFDLYIFKDPKFVIAKADFRIYPLQNIKEVSPFVALQPGYVLYNQNKVKGAGSIDILLGVMARPVQKKGIGISLGVGYSNFGFKTDGATSYNDAVKIQAGIIF